MTRINLVNPSELQDQHLIAEKIAMKPSWYKKTKSILINPIILIFFFLNTLNSQNLDLFEKEIFIQGKDTLNYRIFGYFNHVKN